MIMPILALAAQTTVFNPTPPMLPPSFRVASLAACAPKTLEAAENCLNAALSPEDLAIVHDRVSARRFRPNLDCEIETEWRLTDSSSPMAKVMQEKLGVHHPDLAAGMIISDLQARAAGLNVPFEQGRSQFAAMATKPSNECDVLKTNETQEHKNAN
jgi:uncharacterized protein DUF6794